MNRPCRRSQRGATQAWKHRAELARAGWKPKQHAMCQHMPTSHMFVGFRMVKPRHTHSHTYIPTYLHTYIPYHTIPYHTIPYHTIPYHTIPYHTIPYHTIPYHTIPYHTYHTYIPYIHTIHTYHTYIHTCIPYMHTCMHACMHTYIHTYIYTYMHTCKQPYMHARIHTSPAPKRPAGPSAKGPVGPKGLPPHRVHPYRPAGRSRQNRYLSRLATFAMTKCTTLTAKAQAELEAERARQTQEIAAFKRERSWHRKNLANHQQMWQLVLQREVDTREKEQEEALMGLPASSKAGEQKAKLSRHKICLRRFRVACFVFFPQERYSEAPKTITSHDVQLALRASILHCVSLFLPQAVSCHDSSCQCSSAMHGGNMCARDGPTQMDR